MPNVILFLVASFLVSCASPKTHAPQTREAVIHPKQRSQIEPESLEVFFRKETHLARDKRECAEITFPEDDHLSPYSPKFLACMKNRGWVQKK